MRRFSALIPIIISLTLTNCATIKTRDAGFNYLDIYKRKYIDGTGGIIMLTLEKGEAYSASVSPDQNYLVYSGNQNGNFDLFFRPLNDIISIPILKSSPNQTEPVISPDGKNILFVDDEIDPEGDIAIIPLASERILNKFSRSGQSAVDAYYSDKKVYVTNNLSNPVRARDRNPAWSPDGNFIAFSSNREPGIRESSEFENHPGSSLHAKDNIWIIPLKKPQEGRQITTDGGMMPSYSPDGKKLVYAKTLEDERSTNIYEYDLEANQERPLTQGSFIDFYPSFTAKGDLVFTRISLDTNSDSILDFKDNGQIMIISKRDLLLSQSPEPILLSKKDENIFNTRASTFLGGSILFAMKDRDNINIGVIPESGIFPLKKSPISQLDFNRENYRNNKEIYRLALGQMEISHPSNPLHKLSVELKDFELLTFANAEEKKAVLNSIRIKIKEEHPFEKIMLDIYYLSGNETIPAEYTFDFNGNTLETYLENIYNNPRVFLEKIQSIQDHPSNEYDQSALGYMLHLYANHVFKKGKINLSRKILQKILISLPLYYDIPDILYNLGKSSMDSDIPEEYLFVLFPEKHPYKINLEPIDLENNSKKINYESEILKSIRDPEYLKKIELEIFSFFKNAWQQNKDSFIQQILEKYPQSDYPIFHQISSYSRAFVFFSQKRYKESFALITALDPEITGQSYWKFQTKILLAKNLEKLGHPDKAYQTYAEALLIYDRNYELPEINDLTLRVFQYYTKLANFHKKTHRLLEAWNAYFPLIQIMLHLEPQGIAKEIIQSSSLRIFVDFDEMILQEALDNKTIVQNALDYYGANIADARKYSMNSFIFGRAYLNTMYAIKLHQYHEDNHTLNEINKKKILEIFSEAERDFQWSIYSDPTFFDSYITLGWMYQFIDEKRDSSIFVSKSGTETQIDKIYFSHLYEKYFPDYLFEENIQLYQKSLAFLSGTLSKQITQSFHLNLANNYFLLTNYPKAEENYSKIKTVGKDRYKFENALQEAQFFFHSGKAGYYTGHSVEAAKNLESALNFYFFESKMNNEEKKLRLNQRLIILKYLGLVYSDSGQFHKAIDAYKRILQDTAQIDLDTNLAAVYLEIAYNILKYSKSNNDYRQINEAIDYTKLAEVSLKQSRELLPPSYSAKLKVFGKSIPIYKVNYDWVFRKGENHLAFELPTINQYQYLYSIQGELYKLNGNITGAIESLEKIIQKTGRDNSKHGRETLVSTFMRLGELKFNQGILTDSRSYYSEARKLAYATGNMKSYYLAEKNLMTLASREIENSPENSEKIRLAEKFSAEIDDFKRSYILLKLNEAAQELKDKNKNMMLTVLDKARLENKAILDIQQIMIYRGIFEAYKSIASEYTEIEEQKLDFTKYFDKKSDQYKHIQETIFHLEGNYQMNGSQVSFLNRKKDRRLAMILDMNKALVEKTAGRTENAIFLFRDIFDKAYAFNANELYLVSGYEYYQLIKNKRPDESLKILKKLDSTFKNNTYLIHKFEDIYQKISRLMILENLRNGQYAYALFLENYNRNLNIKPVIDSFLKDSESKLSGKLDEYQEIEKIEEILAGDIEDLKLRAVSTEALEQIMKRLIDRKNSIKSALMNHQDLAGYAFIAFPDILTVNDVLNVKTSYLYLLEINGTTHVIYKNKNENDFKHAEFNLSEIERQSLRQISEQDLQPILSGHNIGKELKNFILWIQKSPVDIVFTDQSYLYFPFSKLLGYQVPREFTFQSAILFEKNRNITATSWIQNGAFRNPASDSKFTDHYTFYEISKPEDIKKYPFNAVDFEISGDGLSKSDHLLKKILQNHNSLSLSLITYNTAEKETYGFYLGALNALFSAAGATMVAHTNLARKDAAEIYTQVIQGKQLQSDTLIFSGNPEISGAFFNQNKFANAEKLLNFQLEEFLRCNRQTGNFMDDKHWESALKNTEICMNIYRDYNFRKSAHSNHDLENSIIYDIPDFDQFGQKIEIILNFASPLSPENVQTIFKNIESVALHDNEASETSKSDFDKFAKKYIEMLLSYGYADIAISELNRLSQYISYSEEELIDFQKTYYYGQLRKGNLNAVSGEIPAELVSFLTSKSISLIPAPSAYSEKIRWLMGNSSEKYIWIERLIESGEYSFLEDSGIQNLPQKLPWQKLSVYAYTKNTDAITKITDTGSNDPDLKNLRTLISAMASHDYNKVLKSIDYVNNSMRKNTEDDFYFKLTHITCVMKYLDLLNTPDKSLGDILERLGKINLSYTGQNHQMNIFVEIFNSAKNIINNPSLPSKTYDSKLSALNMDLILSIKTFALYLHPFKTIENTNFYPDISTTELTDRMELIVNLTKSPESLNTLNNENISYLLEYLIGSGNLEQTLFRYFSYDRNQQPDQFQFPVKVSGIFKTFFDRYYFWTWKKDGVEIIKIKVDQINSYILKNTGSIFYIPFKNQYVKEKLLSRQFGITFYTQSALGSLLMSENESGINPCRADANLQEYAGYSILKMYCQNSDLESENKSWIGFSRNMDKKALVQFYAEPLSLNNIGNTPSITNLPGNYNIIFTDYAALNIYLTFMKEFIFEYNTKPDQPHIIFDKVYNKLENVYGKTSDIKQILILQN